MLKKDPIRFGAGMVVLGVLIMVALPSGASGQSTAPKKKVIFVEGTTSSIKSINPLSPNTVSSSEYEVLELNYDLLLNFDKNTLAAAPGIADKWSKSSDGLTWTFHIRPGVTWQDGQPLTAHDVAWTFNFVVKNQVGTLSSYFPFSTPDSFSAPDDSTFIWKTSKPTTAPEYPPWVYILPEHIWGKMTPKEATTFKDLPAVGSGPFELTQWNEKQSWTLTANKHYWGGAPTIDEYTVKFYSDTGAAVAALKTGEIDYMYGMTPDVFNSLKAVQGITTHAGVPPGFVNLIMNTRGSYPAPDSKGNPIGTGHPALLDPRVRTAIEMAIDKQAIIEKVLRGYGVAGTTVVPPRSTFYHWNPPADQAIPFDIAGANKILDDAGYKDTNGDGVREMPGGGRPLIMRLDVENEDPNRLKAAKYIQGYLKQVGISTTIQADTENKTLSFWYANDFDLYMWGWGPDPDPDFMLSTFRTSQCEVWDDTCYSNKTYDNLYTAQQAATDLNKRQAIIYQMQQIIYKQIPEVVLYYDDFLEAYRSDRWTGFQISPQPNGYLLNQYSSYSVLTLRPLSASQANAGSGGISAGVWVGVVAAIVVIVGLVIMARRRGPREDRA